MSSSAQSSASRQVLATHGGLSRKIKVAELCSAGQMGTSAPTWFALSLRQFRSLRNLNDHVPGGQNDGARGALQGPHLHSDGLQADQLSLTAYQSALCASQTGLHLGLNRPEPSRLQTHCARNPTAHFRRVPASNPPFRHSARPHQRLAIPPRLSGPQGGRSIPGAQ